MLLIELPLPVSYCARSFSNCYLSPVLGPILQMRNQEQERLCDLPRVAPVRSGGAGTRTQVRWAAELSREGFCAHPGSKVCTPKPRARGVPGPLPRSTHHRAVELRGLMTHPGSIFTTCIRKERKEASALAASPPRNRKA